MKDFEFSLEDFKENALSEKELNDLKGSGYTGPTTWANATTGGSDYCWDGTCTRTGGGAYA